MLLFLHILIGFKNKATLVLHMRLFVLMALGFTTVKKYFLYICDNFNIIFLFCGSVFNY